VTTEFLKYEHASCRTPSTLSRGRSPDRGIITSSITRSHAAMRSTSRNASSAAQTRSTSWPRWR